MTCEFGHSVCSFIECGVRHTSTFAISSLRSASSGCINVNEGGARGLKRHGMHRSLADRRLDRHTNASLACTLRPSRVGATSCDPRHHGGQTLVPFAWRTSDLQLLLRSSPSCRMVHEQLARQTRQAERQNQPLSALAAAGAPQRSVVAAGQSSRRWFQ